MPIHITKNFTYDELMCPCCGEMSIDATAIGMLQKAREMSSVKFKINSACRCNEHNKAVGGKQDSSHIIASGKDSYAFDIEALNSRTKFIIICSLLKAGFNRIGIDKEFIHVDNDPNKDKDVIWVY